MLIVWWLILLLLVDAGWLFGQFNHFLELGAVASVEGVASLDAHFAVLVAGGGVEVHSRKLFFSILVADDYNKQTDD